MEHKFILHDEHFDVPFGFVDRIAADIPANVWVRILRDNPILNASVLEGFSGRSNKLDRILRKPQFPRRLGRFLQSNPKALDDLLKVWGEENLLPVAFVEMLDRAFLLENFASLKSLVGPERFFAVLYILGYLENPGVREKIHADFWKRGVNAEVIEPLIPVWSLWSDFQRQFPLAQRWMDEMVPTPPKEAPTTLQDSGHPADEPSRHEGERHRKLEQKLQKEREEKQHLQDQIARYRKENEALRIQVKTWETSFEQRLGEALDHERGRRFERYRGVEEQPLKAASNNLEALLKRADRAFELQREADATHGVVSAVRQKLLQVDLYLKEIEKVYADSLLVHSEVTKVKEALLLQRKRLLDLPGIEKVLRRDSPFIIRDDIRQKIRLLDAVPENLSKISEIQKSLSRLEAIGFIEDPTPLMEDVRQKKRQILETLYAHFQPRGDVTGHRLNVKNFDDFVESGQSAAYDLYVDGYNTLLKFRSKRRGGADPAFSTLREDFIEAVQGKSRLFRKVYLVFDGVESFRDVRRNMEVVYTDKTRGETADIIIIQALTKRGNSRALLVTADQEIIRTTESKVYATVDPYHFYLFVFDLMEPAATEA